MRRALVALLLLASSGCYASHELEADGGTADAAMADGGACFAASSDIYVRNDCEFCNALHYTWLRRCGDRWILSGSYGAARAGFRQGTCGAIRLDACLSGSACVALSECEDTDADSLDALLALRSDFSPRGGALPFEPYDADAEPRPWLDPPTCDALIEGLSTCE